MYKFRFLVIYVSICLVSCNQVGSQITSDSDVVNKNLLNTTSLSTLRAENYDLGKIEELLKNQVCAGFGYNVKNKECDVNLYTSNVRNIGNLANINPEFNLQGSPVVSNQFGVTSVEYVSKKNGTKSYLVMYPKMKDVSKFKGVVLYFHPTLFNKQLAPSVNEDGDSDKTYAAIFASQGYAVILPDYEGMGDDWQNIHPYVIAPERMMQEAKQLLSLEYDTINTKFTKKDDIPVFAVGFSEGAGYAVRFASNSSIGEHYKLKAAIGLDGAYDLSETTFNYLTSDVNAPDGGGDNKKNEYKSQYQVFVNLTKPALMSLVMPTYNKYIVGKDLSYGFNSGFYNMDKCGHLTSKSCTFDEQASKVSIGDALQKKSINNLDYVQKIFSAAVGSGLYLSDGIAPLWINALVNSHQNSISNHKESNKGIFDANILNEPLFKNALKNADAYNFTPTANIALVSLQHDSVVTPVNTDVAYQNLSQKQSNFSVGKYIVDNSDFHVDLTKGSKVIDFLIPNEAVKYNRLDHLQAEPFLDIIALRYIENIDKVRSPVSTKIELRARGSCEASYKFKLTFGKAKRVLFDDVSQPQCQNIDINECSIDTKFPTTKKTEEHELQIDEKVYEITYICSQLM